MILVSSMPRSGSTMLCRAIEKIPPGSVWPVGIAETVVKTYLPPPNKCDGKAIYLFADVYNCIYSTLRERDRIGHYKNCGCEKLKEKIDILQHDDMNLELTFDGWTKGKFDYSVLILRYETMFDYIAQIEEYVGHECRFPEWKERQTSVEKPVPEIESVYGDLIEKISLQPDFEVRG